jgi:hypothetical protein
MPSQRRLTLLVIICDFALLLFIILTFMTIAMLAIGDSQPHLEQREDFESISSQQQQHQHHETEGTTNQEDAAHKKTDICLIKRKAILLLSKAHKSESTGDTQKAMSLFTALYKAETEQDLASLDVEIRQLLKSKQQQDEIATTTTATTATTRRPKNMESTETPERFSRFRTTWSRFFQPNAASPTTSRRSNVTRNQQVAQNATTWKMFWQVETHPPAPVVPHRVAVHRFSLPSFGDHGLDGLEESSLYSV